MSGSDSVDEIAAELAAEKARVKKRYAEAGIPFVDYPDQDVREYRLRLEKKALASRESDSLRTRIMRIISAGAFVDDNNDAGSDSTPERALLRYAAATAKAAALALKGTEYVTSNEPFEIQFDDSDAAIVLCGLSELLEVGPELITSVALADQLAARANEATDAGAK